MFSDCLLPWGRELVFDFLCSLQQSHQTFQAHSRFSVNISMNERMALSSPGRPWNSGDLEGKPKEVRISQMEEKV